MKQAARPGARPGLTFAEMLAPVPLEEFFGQTYGKRWRLIRGTPEKAAAMFGWDDLNAVLQLDVWSGFSMNLILDGERQPHPSYCRSVMDRNRMQVMRPDPDKVMALLKRGATIVLNELGGVSPSVGRTVDSALKTLNAIGNANLYYSQKAHRAFNSHCDAHEVFALQISGEKVWRVYKGRENSPIEHPNFRGKPKAEIDLVKGPVDEEIVMRPGDVLYLPRGQYHDALASSDDTMHITFSCQTPVGLNVMQDMVHRMMQDPAFRQDLPRPDGPLGQAALQAHMDALVKRFADFYTGQNGLRLANEVINAFPRQVAGRNYDIPNHRDAPRSAGPVAAPGDLSAILSQRSR